MCNLLGIYNKEQVPEKLVEFSIMAQVLAGMHHSDGFGYFDNNARHKKTWLAADVSTYPQSLLEKPFSWAITHVRKTSSGSLPKPTGDDEKEWKTYREKKQRYAHPFVFDNSVIAHNGTFDKKDVDYEMDSLFFGQKFNESYEESRDVDKALDSSLSFFDGGLASLLLAVKENDTWVPYIMKGNKPLYRVTEEKTGTIIIITDKDYIDKLSVCFSQVHNFKFSTPEFMTNGLHNPFEAVPIVQKTYISKSYKTTATYGADYNTTKWNNRVNNSTKSPKFSEFVNNLGRSKLAQLSLKLVKTFSEEQIFALLNNTEDEIVKILEGLQ